MVRNNILVGKRDAGILTTGNLENASGEWSLAEGQFAFFDPETEDILGNTGAIDAQLYPKLGIAVGYRDVNGKLRVRKTAGDFLLSTGLLPNPTAEVPRCGKNQITDLMVDCVSTSDTGEVYSITVEVMDSRSGQRFGNHNVGEMYKFTVTSEELDKCESCDSDSRLDQVVCAMVNKVNTGTVTGERPDYLFGENRSIERQAFHAAVLQKYATRITIPSATAGDCEKCNGVTALATFSVSTIGDPETLDLSDYIVDGITPHENLPKIVAAINASNDLNVTAHLLSSGQNCCGHEIEIIHCEENATVKFIDNEDSDITGVRSTPLDDNVCTKVEVCHSCDEAAAATPLSAGIRFYFDPVAYQKWEYGYIEVPDVPIRMGNIYASDKGFLGFTKWCMFPQRTAEWPINLGWQWYWYELATDNGGIGREHSLGIGSVLNQIKLGQTKVKGIASDPDEQYCSIIIPSEKGFKDGDALGYGRRTRTRDILLIPFTETATMNTITDLFNSWAGSIANATFPEIRCADESENLVDDDPEGDDDEYDPDRDPQ